MTKLQDRAEVGIYCPKCSPPPKLIVRTNRQNGTQFLGCPNYPRCDHTQEIPEDIKGGRRHPAARILGANVCAQTWRNP